VQGKGVIPKTRSGKTLRRVLRELVENQVHGEPDKEVSVPATVEDASVVDVAREKGSVIFEPPCCGSSLTNFLERCSEGILQAERRRSTSSYRV